MNLRQKITLGFLLYTVLGSATFAQVVEIPDPNLKHAVIEALNLPAGAPITQDDMRQLKRLDTLRAGITSLQGLEFATELERLAIPLSPISDLMPISGLVKLIYLDGSGCQIEDLSPLANLKQLISLNLERNKIRDVRPLAELVNLRTLYIQRNPVLDFRPLDNLRLITFEYDEACELDPLPLEPRLESRDYPSIFARWSGPTWPPVKNRHDLTGVEKIALHDLWFSNPQFDLDFRETPTGFTLAGQLDDAIQRRDEFLSLNPNMIFLVHIDMHAYNPNDFPEDWPHWIRDSEGNITETGYIDFTHPFIQNRIIQHAIAISRCGLYDGMMFDWWNEQGAVLVDQANSTHEYRGNEAEQRARDNILKGIRAAVRPNFLIMANTNLRTIPRTGPYINGGFMESGIPGFYTDDFEMEHWLNIAEKSLFWLDNNVREPRINGLEGFCLLTEPPDGPNNLRWMRAITTLSLTHSNGYVVFSGTGIPDDYHHYWFNFWDADLGRPVSEKGQLYQDTEGIYIREFTNGWAVYNHSGEPQIIKLPEEVQGVASGLVNTVHELPNLDGEMYLKETTAVHGNDIYIAEPINAVSGAALLLDASNNPESIARWTNLGTSGGSLLSSDRHDRRPRVEEGKIEIPSIGFSGRRKFYTATASGQTFGGPIDTNPKLYLGDWTLEFLCKRNGNRFDLEHQFAGFQNSPREELQGIRLRLPNGGQELGISIHAGSYKYPGRALNIFLEENVWTWVTVVSKNAESIVAYQDGVEVSRHPGVYFDPSLPLDDISIGANSYEERRRNFNGSFSIVRVYDRALNPDEVLQNIGATVVPTANPADVNDDGEVNILDLVAVASNLSQTGENDADVNGDGIVNILDLVQVAGAIGAGGAAPSASSLDLSMISAADVERWLAGAQGSGVGDANFQRGIRFLQQLLALLTPQETSLLPNYPNPFNPETWIAYRLARAAEVAITIYDTKGTPVRRLALGNQAAGHYAARGKAAYWDGRNEGGEAVASGIYFYQFRAGDYVASRRMVILK